MFHAINKPALNAAGETAGSTRVFEGDGTPYLKLPDCLEVTRVVVGSTVVPQFHEQKYPKNTDFLEKLATEVPLWKLDLDGEGDGIPILLRSHQSNDGFWQKGVKIYISGEWGDAPSAEGAAPSDAAKARADEFNKTTPADDAHALLTGMPYNDLKAYANAMSLDVPANIKKPDLIALIAAAEAEKAEKGAHAS